MAKRYFKFVNNQLSGGVRVNIFANSNGGTYYPCIDTALEEFINKCNNAKLLAVVENDKAISDAKRIAQEYKDAQAKANQLPERVYRVTYSDRDGFEIAKYITPSIALLPCKPTSKSAIEYLASLGLSTSPELAVKEFKAKVAAQLDALLLKGN